MKPFPERSVADQTHSGYTREKPRKLRLEKKAFWGSIMAVFLLSLVLCSAYWANAAKETKTAENNSLLTSYSDPVDLGVNDNTACNSSVLDSADLNITGGLLSGETDGYPLEPYDYLFWENEGNYFTPNGTTRKTDYSGNNLAQIVANVVSGSTDGLFLCFKKGVYTLTSTINITEKNDIRIMGAGKELTKICGIV